MCLIIGCVTTYEIEFTYMCFGFIQHKSGEVGEVCHFCGPSVTKQNCKHYNNENVSHQY